MISMHFQVYKCINSIPEQIFSKFFHKTSHHLISLYYRVYRLGKSTSLRKTPKNTRKTGIRHIAIKHTDRNAVHTSAQNLISSSLNDM